MDSKEETLAFIEKCIKAEEAIIPLYAQHIDNTLFFGGFSEEKAAAIKNILRTLKTDSQRHQATFEALYAKVKEA
jgi:endonuclease III